MSLDYDKIVSKRHQGDSLWTAYADLFMMLSMVFLLLYVTASLKSGASSVQGQVEYKKLAAEAADLREQNRVYNTLKDDYVEKNATKDEQKTYEELMDKLSLLKDQAKNEKIELRKQAAENHKKEIALNKYQQIIRNIINANLLAKSGLKSRDEVIATKKQKIASLGQEITEQSKVLADTEAVLTEKQATLQKQEQVIAEKQQQLQSRAQEVDALKQEVDAKQQTIAKNDAAITAANAAMAAKVQELKDTQKRENGSKKALQESITALEQDTARKIAALEGRNAEASAQIQETTSALSNAKGQLASAQSALDARTAEKERLAGELKDTTSRLNGQIDGMKKAFADEMDGKQKAFDKEMAGQKLTAAGRAAKEKAFKDAADARAKELGDQIAALGDKIKDAEGNLKNTQGKLDNAEKAQKQFKNYIAALENDKKDLADDLKKSQDQLRDKRKLAKLINDAFAKNHIKATVDPKTGDVIVNFDEYFDTGRADLKDRMKGMLQKLVPVYTASLFKDAKIAEKISSVDIIGFASPTYKGRYVDPESLKSDDRQAVNFNLDLSYQRAKSIFSYIFDTNTMRYAHQKSLLPLVKVTGRSYLAEGVKGRDVDQSLEQKDFCKKYDCQKDQKVVIKFNLKD